MFFKKACSRYVQNRKIALVSAGVSVSGKVFWGRISEEEWSDWPLYKVWQWYLTFSCIWGCVGGVCLSVCVVGMYAKGMFVVDKSMIDVWGLGVWVYRYVLWNRGNSVTSSLLKGLDSSKEYLCFFVTSS